MLEASKDLAFVYVTFSNESEARTIATAAIDARVAACANIFAPHTSIYRWKDKIEIGTEIAVIFKTTIEKLVSLTAHIEKNHSYDTPCVAVLKPEQVNSAFGNWIREATAEIEST